MIKNNLNDYLAINTKDIILNAELLKDSDKLIENFKEFKNSILKNLVQTYQKSIEYLEQKDNFIL